MSVSLFTNLLVVFYVHLDEIVPIFVYYHSGIALFAIGQEIKSPRNLASTNGILNIWSHYNQVRELTIKADQLFGSLIVTNIGRKFALICTCAYSTLYYVFETDERLSSDYSRPLAIMLTIGLIVFIVELSTSVIFSSNLVRASENLKIVTGDVYNRYWKLMEPEARETLRAFRAEQENELVACPLNLFHITPSLLLSMTGLIVTYTIVLLQAN